MRQRDFVAPLLLIVSSLAGLADYLLPLIFVWSPEIPSSVQTLLFASAVVECAPDFAKQGEHTIYATGKICSGIALFVLVSTNSILVPVIITIGYLILSLCKNTVPTSAQASIRLLIYTLLTSFLVLIGHAFSPVFEIMLFMAGTHILFTDSLQTKNKTPMDSQMINAIGNIINTPFLTVLSAVLLASIFISLSYGRSFFVMTMKVFIPNFVGLFVGSPVAAASAVVNVLFLFIISTYFAYLLIGVSESWVSNRSLSSEIPELHGTAFIPIIGYILTRLPHHKTQHTLTGYKMYEDLLLILGMVFLLVYSFALFSRIKYRLPYNYTCFITPDEGLISAERHLVVSLLTLFVYVSYLTRADILLMMYFAWLLWFPVLWVCNSGVAGRALWVLMMPLMDIVFIQSGQGTVADHILMSGVFIRNVGILGLLDQLIDKTPELFDDLG